MLRPDQRRRFQPTTVSRTALGHPVVPAAARAEPDSCSTAAASRVQSQNYARREGVPTPPPDPSYLAPPPTSNAEPDSDESPTTSAATPQSDAGGCDGPSTPAPRLRIDSDRARWARNYALRRGDLEEALRTPAATLDLTSSALSYVHLLEQEGVTANTDDTPSHATAAGLWALLPVAGDWSLPATSATEFADNPCCTDRSPLVGPRKGGREVRRAAERHSSTTVTVHMAAEGSTALYGQYLNHEALSGSLRCNVEMSVPNATGYGEPVTIRTVVDTGATWTAVRLREALDSNGSKDLNFEPADVTFTGISGKQLRCLGWTVLRLHFGSMTINTKAFVFPDMHEPMLLGLNTLAAEGLCVDVGRMGMYPSPTDALPPTAVPLFTGEHDAAFYTSARRDTMYLAQAGKVYASVPCSATPPASHRRKGGIMSKLPVLATSPDLEDADDDGTASILSLVTEGVVTGRPTPKSKPRGTRQAIAASLIQRAWRRSKAAKRAMAKRRRKVERLSVIEDLQERGWMRRPDDHLATAIVATDAICKPHTGSPVHLFFVHDIPGKNRSIEVSPSPQFCALFPELGTGTEYELVSCHASAQRVGQYRFHNYSDYDVTIPAGTIFGSVQGLSLADSNSFNLQHHPEWVMAMLECSAYRFDITREQGVPSHSAQRKLWALLSVAATTGSLPPPTSPTSDDDATHATEHEGTASTDVAAEFEGIGSSAVDFEYLPHDQAEYEKLPFDRGGRARTPADLEEMGLDLSKAVDASLPDCPPISDEDRALLEKVCLEQGAVWARNAKVPTPAKHPWARCEIHTGDAPPVKQKPYPIPQKYLEAVRKEIDGLLKAGLIEPGFGNWASPVICIVKKDSSASELRIKLAIDFRAVNAVTVVDCALLGDQADILQCFHGRPHLTLADAAAGFYQFSIEESSRVKTGFCLPSSCGGTLFQWKVAPYGLTNMPAIYSRAMQHVLRGIVDVDLGYALDEQGRVIDPDHGHLGVGSAPTWVDDITLSTGGASPGYGIRGHCELLRRVFQRLILAGMTLKPSKTDILHRSLKVLGFEVTREGVAPQADKVKAIQDIPPPTNPNEVLAFLGVINFNRAFVPALGHIAHPLYELLKGYKSSELKARRRPGARPLKEFVWTDECDRAFTELKGILAHNCLTAHPDLTDPEAEFVLMTDASTRAAGAVLMQWQKRQEWEVVETPSVVESADGFSSAIAKRLAAGYTLKTLGFYSKTFAHAQVNWAIFDKEAASIVMALTHWHRLVAGRPITVYTDNTVASSILTNAKAHRPPRLQRWGIVLGTYLPHLRIAYRKGELNPVADLLSRYPSQINYTPSDSDIAEVPDDLFDKILSVHFNGRKFVLSEPKVDTVIDQIWADLGEDMPPDDKSAEQVLKEGDGLESGPGSAGMIDYEMNALLSRFKTVWEADDLAFQRERAAADNHLDHWAQYVRTFESTYGRPPVLYDLYCGGGGFSRGAARAGFKVVGIDIRDKPSAYGRRGLSRTLSNQFLRETIQGMHYHQADVEKDDFWNWMMSQTRLHPDLPPPDVIHASPPCSPHSALRHLPLADGKIPESSLRTVVDRLVKYKSWAARVLGRHVPFSVENVEGAKHDAMLLGMPWCLLCGTMFGLKVFRHRVFITDRPLMVELGCSHEGKGVGRRGINRTGLGAPDYPEDALSNMYAPYSWYQPTRGTRDELHRAMGFEPGAMGSYRDLTLSLPPDYGEYIACQLLAQALQSNLQLPVIGYNVARMNPAVGEALASWSVNGFRADRKLPSHVDLGSSPTLRRELAALRIQTHVRRSAKYDVCRGATDPAPLPAQRLAALMAPLIGEELPEDDGPPRDGDSPDEDDCDPDARPLEDGEEEAPTVGPQHRGRRKRRPLHPPTFDENDETPRDWKGPWSILLETQLLDPEGRTVHESLAVTEALASQWSPARLRQARRHRAKYCLHLGRIHAMTKNGPRLYVPFQLRYALVSVTHRALDLGGHRGTEPLYNQIGSRYYWDGMLSDCEEVVSRCEVCRVRDLSHQLHPRFAAMPDPPHPFHTIYIDYKDVPGSKDGAKSAILIVVDGLTRYTIAIPVGEKTAEETFASLAKHVFAWHSYPCVLRSDNGPEFRNELEKEFKKYVGYRHVHVLPYNARANGKAESTVKRVQELLIKHCRLLDNWAETLPTVCFALNCAKHASTQLSPFFALFGREPIMIPELEDPSGYRVTYSGPEFMRNHITELRRAWDAVRDASEEVRASVIKRGERSRVHWDSSSDKDGCAGIHVGDWVLLKHGSDAHAKIRRKYGYPAYRRFRVVRIIPEASAVELDVRGLTIQPVVSVRQCKRAPEEWYLFNDGSLSSGRYDGPLTMAGAKGNPHEVGGRTADQAEPDEVDTHQDACVYPVEWVLEAFHSKRRWWYRVLWLGYPTATWESHEDLEATAGIEVLKWMAQARERFQAKFRRKGGNADSTDYPLQNSSLLDRSGPAASGESSSEESDEEAPPLDPFETDNAAESAATANVDASSLGDVPAEAIRQAPARDVRALHEERPPVTFQADERTQRRLRRATQLALTQDNCFRTLRGEVGRQIDALFVPSLLT